ncbi:MAG: SPFH domain-containing protein [Ruminococcus sp.]
MMNNKIQKTVGSTACRWIANRLQRCHQLPHQQGRFAVIYAPSAGLRRHCLRAIQESMKAITAQYTAEELITKRSAVGEEIGATLAEKVQEYGILIDKFNIINFDFSAEFNDAIEQKQVAEQNKLRAETEKEQKIIEAQADAEQKVIAAKAEADAIRQKAEAEADANEKINASLNENVLKYQQIEKWNGEYPNVVSSDSSILVGVSSGDDTAAAQMLQFRKLKQRTTIAVNQKPCGSYPCRRFVFRRGEPP